MVAGLEPKWLEPKWLRRNVTQRRQAAAEEWLPVVSTARGNARAAEAEAWQWWVKVSGGNTLVFTERTLGLTLDP